MQILSGSSVSPVMTVEQGRLVPAEGRVHPLVINAAQNGAIAMPAMHGVRDDAGGALLRYTNDSRRAPRAGQSARVPPIRRAKRAQWLAAQDSARRIMNVQDAFTVNPAGAPFLDLIGRLQEVAEMPRPPALFDRAFPDRLPFQPGIERVTADLAMYSGRPMIGWRNSLDDIPNFKMGFVTTQLATAWLVLNVPVTMQDAARAAISGAALGVVDRLNLAIGEAERAIDYCRWNGNTAAQITGILSHPFLSRYQDLDIDLSSSTPAQVYQSFIEVATYAKANTRGAGKVDTCFMSYKIVQKLAGQFVTIGGTPIAKTLLDAISEEFGKLGITILSNDDPWWPLDDAGGTGVHGVMFYSREPQRVPAALQAIELTAYPDVSNPLQTNTYLVACFGDVHLRQAQSTLLALYTVS